MVKILCPEERIQPYLASYLQMYLFVAPISLLAVALKLFVSVDGNLALVTKAATTEGVLNVMFDVLLVKGLGFGIEGSALATGIGQLGTVCMMIWSIRSSRCRMGFEFHIPGWTRLLINNMKEGLPIMFGNLTLAAAVRNQLYRDGCLSPFLSAQLNFYRTPIILFKYCQFYYFFFARFEKKEYFCAL